jgi:hypothetical protein
MDMSIHTFARSVTLAVAMMAAGGCSLAVRGPGRATYNADGSPAEPDCTDDTPVPMLDVVAGTGLIILGNLLMRCEVEDPGAPIVGPYEAGACATSMIVGIPLVLGGVVQGGIGTSGFRTTSACREAKAKHRRHLAAMADQRAQFLPQSVPFPEP